MIYFTLFHDRKFVLAILPYLFSGEKVRDPLDAKSSAKPLNCDVNDKIDRGSTSILTSQMKRSSTSCGPKVGYNLPCFELRGLIG